MSAHMSAHMSTHRSTHMSTSVYTHVYTHVCQVDLMANRMGSDGEIAPEELAEELMKHGYAPPRKDLEAVVRACDSAEGEEEEEEVSRSPHSKRKLKKDKSQTKEDKSDGNVTGDEFKNAMKQKTNMMKDLDGDNSLDQLTEVEACWEKVKVLVNEGLYRTLKKMHLCDEAPTKRSARLSRRGDEVQTPAFTIKDVGRSVRISGSRENAKVEVKEEEAFQPRRVIWNGTWGNSRHDKCTGEIAEVELTERDDPVPNGHNYIGHNYIGHNYIGRVD